jgi:hypothetical protein
MDKKTEKLSNADMIIDSNIEKISLSDEKLRQEVLEVIAQADRGEVMDIDEAFKAVYKVIEKMPSCSPST